MTERIVLRRLVEDLRRLIAEARQDVAWTVNSARVLLYWQIGQRIRLDILKERRAGYGEQIVYALRGRLAAELVLREKLAAHDPVRRRVSERADCRAVVATIGMESFHWRGRELTTATA